MGRKQMLLALARAYDNKTMGKKDKQKLAGSICTLAMSLVKIDEDNGNGMFAVKRQLEHTGCQRRVECHFAKYRVMLDTPSGASR